MSFRLDVAGVQQQDQIRRGPGFSVPSFEFNRNQRPRLTFDLDLNPPPAKRAQVIAYDKAGTTKVFGGLVERRTPLLTAPGADLCYRIEVVGFSRYYDWCYWTKNYTADKTLKQVLTDLVADKLTAYGIALDAGQVNGPLLTAPFGWTNRKVSDVIRDLVEQTGYMETTDADLKLKMFVPGTETFGTTIDNLNASKVDWSDSTQVPATKVICIFGPSGTDSVTQLWTANGTDTSWVTDIPAAVGATAPGYVTVNGIFCTVGAGAMFEWTEATSTLSVGTAATPSAGHVIELVYVAQFPFTITKDSLASPAIEAVLLFPSITDYAQADATADEQLSQTNQDPRVFAISTLEDGIWLGWALPIDVDEVDAEDTSAIVTRVAGTLNTDLFWEYAVSAEETSASLQKDPLSRLKQAIGQPASGSSVSSGTGGGSTTVLSSPFPLGGSDTSSIPQPTAGYAQIWNANVFYCTVTMTVLVRAWLWARSADNTQFELYCIDDLAPAAASSVVAAGTSRPTDPTSFSVVVEAGKRYVGRAKSTTNGVSVYAIATLFPL